jgi:hypothetical protein
MLTGAHSTGFVCYAGCTTSMFTLYNNVLDVAGRIGNLEGSMSGGNNVYWRGSMYSIQLMPGDRYVDPGFQGSGLVPGAGSPLVDTGRKAPMKTDLEGRQTGVDGNGDGLPGADIGAYEVKGKKRHHHHNGGKAHHHHGGPGHHEGRGQHQHHGGKGHHQQHHGGKGHHQQHHGGKGHHQPHHGHHHN